MSKNILESWPHRDVKPREIQKTALDWLQKHARDFKYLVMEAPVGSGKSYIGLTLSRFLAGGQGDSFILTPQRILQDQYREEFQKDGVAPFYGKSNYVCATKGVTCDIGGLLKPKCGHCSFDAAKKAAQRAPNVVLNYKLAMLSFGYTNTFKPRKLMILDECHSLEDYLVDFNAVTVTEHRAKKCGVLWSSQNDMTRAHSWLSGDYIEALRTRVAALEEECEPIERKDWKSVTKVDIQKLRELNGFLEHLEEVEFVVRQKIDDLLNEFVLVHSDTQFQFKPLYARENFADLIAPMADKFLFMSSTIFDKKGFCEDLGLPENETRFISLESEFPKENRPVYVKPVMKMNFGWNSPDNAKKRDFMVREIKEILEQFKGESGIIHSGNFAISKWLVEELRKDSIPHLIFEHNPNDLKKVDRNAQIKEFTASENPSILISPSITEGLDLKDAKSRFCVFVKVPFPNLADQWINRRMKLSDSWYKRKTFTNIVQGAGRVVRSREDWGVSFILDESFGYLYNTFQYKVPKWWKEALLK